MIKNHNNINKMSCISCKQKDNLCQHENIKPNCHQCCRICQENLKKGITSYAYCHPICFTSYCRHGYSKNECTDKDCRFNKNYVESYNLPIILSSIIILTIIFITF